MHHARALVLEEFNKPFQLREFPLPTPGPGEILAKVLAAGICGSDKHTVEGKDPRTPLPIILGHEGVGEIVAFGDGVKTADGENLFEGMPIVWERSLTCSKCYFCVRNQRYLCVERKIYGINISCAEPPHLSGNFATHILLRKGTSIFKRDEKFDPAVLVAATCSGATAAHAFEQSGLKEGDTLAIYGCGTIAIFLIAFAQKVEKEMVVVITRSPGVKSKVASEFDPRGILFKEYFSSEHIAESILERTAGIGVDAVIDTTPDPNTFREAMGILRRGGTYVNLGLGIPAEKIPLDVYSDIVNKNATIMGTWASDTHHLKMAIDLIEWGQYPFEKIITHRFSLDEHENAWQALNDKSAMKIVFEPWKNS